MHPAFLASNANANANTFSVSKKNGMDTTTTTTTPSSTDSTGGIARYCTTNEDVDMSSDTTPTPSPSTVSTASSVLGTVSVSSSVSTFSQQSPLTSTKSNVDVASTVMKKYWPDEDLTLVEDFMQSMWKEWEELLTSENEDEQCHWKWLQNVTKTYFYDFYQEKSNNSEDVESVHNFASGRKHHDFYHEKTKIQDYEHNRKLFEKNSLEEEQEKVDKTLGACWQEWHNLSPSRKNFDNWKELIWKLFICQPVLIEYSQYPPPSQPQPQQHQQL